MNGDEKCAVCEGVSVRLLGLIEERRIAWCEDCGALFDGTDIRVANMLTSPFDDIYEDARESRLCVSLREEIGRGS